MDLQKLKSLPIEGVAQRLGLTVTRHRALCPFHEDRHPSLTFRISTNTYKCFACGAHGGVIDLSMHLLGKDFKEACLWLAGEHNIILSYEPPPMRHAPSAASQQPIAERYSKFFHHPYLNHAAREFLFTERKLHPAVIRWCRLHSYTDRYGTPWLQIPYYDMAYTLIGVQFRRLGCRVEGVRSREGVESRAESIEDKENIPDSKSLNPTPSTLHQANSTPYTLNPTPELPRFRFPRGSRIAIYNLPILQLLRPGEELWIAEGCSDCWALLSSGRKAIAIPSATLLKPSDLEALRPKLSTLHLHMAPDADAPGEQLFLQLQRHFPHLVRHRLPMGYKDFAEYYSQKHV